MLNRFFSVSAIILAILMTSGSVVAQGGDVLNEVPLYAVPEGMTFEEYQDMNRRLTVGLVLSAIPVPGMIHFYAGEKKTGAVILGSAIVGLGSIIAGAAMAEDGDFPDSDFEILVFNEGDKDRERRFEQIPFEQIDGVTTYRFKEIHREPDGAGIALIAAGAAILFADIVYDFVHGVKTIEHKRNQVRFKYGRSLDIGMIPKLDFRKQSVGLGLAVAF